MMPYEDEENIYVTPDLKEAIGKRKNGIKHISATGGPCVGHISPEAWEGGPLAFVKDGDIIEINLNEKRLELKVSDEEMEKRKTEFYQPDHPAKGMLAGYRAGVASADKGALWLYRD